MYHHSRYRAHTNSLTIVFLCITTQDTEPTPTALPSYSHVSPLKIQSPRQQPYNRIPVYHHSRYRAHTNSLTIVFLCITTQDTEPTPTVLQSYSHVSQLKIQSSQQQSYNRIPMYHHSRYRYRAHTNSLTIVFLCITTQDTEPTPTVLESYSYVSPLKIQSPRQQSYHRIPTHHNSRCSAHANSLTIVFLCITTHDTQPTPTVLQSYSYTSPLKIQSSHQQSYNRIPIYHHSRYRAHTNSLTIVFLCITTQDTELTPTVLQSYSYVSPLQIQSSHQQSYNRIPMYHHSRYRAHTNSLTIVFLCIIIQDTEPTPTVLQQFSYLSPLKIQSSH